MNDTLTVQEPPGASWPLAPPQPLEAPKSVAPVDTPTAEIVSAAVPELVIVTACEPLVV